MIGGEIFVSNMGSCNIMSIAKAISGDSKPTYNLIGLKSREKEYEELVTDSEEIRTRVKDNLYVIIPDTLEIMPDSICDLYHKNYNKELSILQSSLRSDENMLSDHEVFNLLHSAELLG